ncbi:hypothetical protein TWF569_005343 [Orbilia oligospora]|uniref:Uncharacterized protein n=2 Tax=Orbilia oligospora TaxID=2813651 RepID=A0A7C8N8A3_ORBOL|nr:hypothetical protein TWF103_000751 [Orbilia oligospora]KAF3099181.1 hypothetical protein TWF102_005587 [Orbilia oligospora]KAF3107860.1 hypothetical protein TWF706_002668 [Orbilia oligospora]KAF3148857.1 hypothetical protein TWF569_005343 [Orbilia oligospora]
MTVIMPSSSLTVPTDPLSNSWNYVVDFRTLDRVSETLETRVRLTKLEGEAILTELTLVQQQIDEVLKSIEGMKGTLGGGKEWLEIAEGAFGELTRMQLEVEEKVGRMGKVMDVMDELGMELDLWLRYQSTNRNYKPR